MFRRQKKAKASVDYELQTRLAALGRHRLQNELALSLRTNPGAQRPYDFVRPQGRIPGCGIARRHAKIFYVSARRLCVRLLYSAVRMERVALLVHSSYDTSDKVDQKLFEQQSAAISRRLLGCRGIQPRRQHTGSMSKTLQSDRPSTSLSWASAPPGQGNLGLWHGLGRASRRCNRYSVDALLHNQSKNHPAEQDGNVTRGDIQLDTSSSRPLLLQGSVYRPELFQKAEYPLGAPSEIRESQSAGPKNLGCPTEGDGRLIYGNSTPSWNLRTDASDVGYGATLGRNLLAGSPGEQQVQAIWSPFLRLKSITARELTAVRRSLQDLRPALSLSEARTVLLHTDNQAVAYILGNMVSASPDLMVELRKLHLLLTKMRISLQAQWLPSGENKHADTQSRTWNPRGFRVTESLFTSVAKSLQLQECRHRWPLKEAPLARRKVMLSQFQDFWGDGKSRLWNPPTEWIQTTLDKIQQERAHGVLLVPDWTGQPWYGRLCSMGR